MKIFSAIPEMFDAYRLADGKPEGWTDGKPEGWTDAWIQQF
jgi:hypothetical protein